MSDKEIITRLEEKLMAEGEIREEWRDKAEELEKEVKQSKRKIARLVKDRDMWKERSRVAYIKADYDARQIEELSMKRRLTVASARIVERLALWIERKLRVPKKTSDRS